MNRENVKRYFVFAYDLHYPAGGMGDFVRAFTDLGDAKIYAQRVTVNFTASVGGVMCSQKLNG